MKKPLFTQFFSLISDRSLKPLTIALLSMVTFVNVSLAQTFSQSECHCLNNATTSTNGQYRDTITITGIPGQTWRLMNPIGFYNPMSMAPPAAPILYLNNTIIPETGPGTGIYRLTGLRVSGQSWSLVVTNGSAVQAMSNNFSCSYPAPPATTITGDSQVCQSSTEIYSIPNSALLSSIVWSVPAGGMITAGQNTNSITVNWGANPGNYGVSVKAKLASYVGQPNPCDFSTSMVARIVNPVSLTSLRGDFGNCIGALEKYSIAASPTQVQNVAWSVTTVSGAPYGPSIPPCCGNNSVMQTIQWPSSPGEYDLTVSGEFVLTNGSTTNACPFTSTRRVNIVNEPTIPLACNNLVQLSMNPSCELTFSPDQFLQDQRLPNSSYDVVIRDIERDTIIPSGTLGYKYINKTLEIKVIHECSGNSCWGYAKIEDKSIPDLVCPADVTINCSDLGNFNVTGYPAMPVGAERIPIANMPGKWLLRNYDLCSDVTLSYVDKSITNLCDGPYSSIITRTWSIVDNSANTSSCVQTIYVNRADVRDVVFPGNYDSVTGPNASLEACGPWIKIPEGQSFAGNPSPETTGYPVGTLCLNASVTFKDDKLPLCGLNAFKIIRKWTVVDHCEQDPMFKIRTHNQLITVMDTKAPIIVCPDPVSPGVIANIFAVQHGCGGNWNVIAPKTITDCSSTTWEVHFLLTDATGNFPVSGVYVKQSGSTSVNGNNTIISNLPFGRTRIRYTATDACDNSAQCVVEVNVIDNQPPTPVCDKNTIIAVGNNGMAEAGVLTFDDGSHDNCALDFMKVRRMDQNIDWVSLPKNNKVKFSCADIGKVIMVELGVWDKAGLSNSCMVEARVQDNIFPELTVPGPRSAFCYEDFTSLTRFGTATVTDNCVATVSETRQDQLNDCGLGTIIRTFVGTDSFGNKVTKTQVITVTNDKPFTLNDIDWPDNITLSNACVQGVKPADLPVASAFPRYIRNTQCAQIASNYEDIVFNFTEEACSKILRKWTVIDWCQTVPGFPLIGTFSYTQIIMVNNTKAPDFEKGCSPNDIIITQIAACRANVKVSALAKDDCTLESNLKYTYTIDEGNNGSIEVANGVGKSIDRNFDYGTHKITWSVKDACNNVKTCTNIFTIVDDKKPTPYCITEIVTVIMPTTKEVTIWASDFNKGATDNCSVGNQITSSFSATNRNDISRTIKCADLNGAASKSFSYNVYSIDAAGNSDFCTVNLIVQANNNSCGGTITGNTNVALRGSIYNEKDELVQNVKIELRSDQVEFPKSANSDIEGKFSFAELPMYKDYTISPDKNDDILNGVSTLDLVMIQRHILGLNELDSPYKLIAADVNNSSKVSASDLVELRKLILGIQTEFTNNKSWRFVDVAYQFADVKNPFPFTEYAQMTNLDHDVAGIDFIAVKIGDVNGSAKSNGLNSHIVTPRNIVTLHANAVTGRKGDIVNVSIKASELQAILGIQFTLGFEKYEAELVDINSNTIKISEENLGLSQMSNGLIHISWNTNQAMDIKDQLFTIRMKLLKDVVDASIVSLDRAYLSPEAYINEASGSISTIGLKLETGNRDLSSLNKFELYQNVPNPFNNTTTIGFNLPVADKVSFKVFDLNGKLIYQTKAQFAKGYNSINLDVNTLNVSGILYYQLDTDTDSATRKMIVIK